MITEPLLSFQEKVMIVDSPGVGESDVMSEFVLNYLSRAFCFMYVINSDNAGGVQEDRVSNANCQDAKKSKLLKKCHTSKSLYPWS